ncbi:hypothetical protein BGZ52_000069, partial [Haplosporangium bisporale]
AQRDHIGFLVSTDESFPGAGRTAVRGIGVGGCTAHLDIIGNQIVLGQYGVMTVATVCSSCIF